MEVICKSVVCKFRSKLGISVRQVAAEDRKSEM